MHRDLKPDNVKINQDSVVKILDFGIAKNMGETKNPDPISPTTPMSPLAVTAEGTFMGTPVYMSPEQARGKTVDKRTDIWAFGFVCMRRSPQTFLSRGRVSRIRWVLASTIAQDRTTLLGMALVSTEQSSRAIKLPLDNAQGSEALFEVEYSTGSPKLSPDD